MDIKLKDLKTEVDKEEKLIYEKAFTLYIKDRLREAAKLRTEAKKEYDYACMRYDELTVEQLEKDFKKRDVRSSEFPVTTYTNKVRGK